MTMKTTSSVQVMILILCLCTLGKLSAAQPSDPMRVTLLGTGTPYPNAERFGPAVLVEAGGKKLLFDCGRGAVIRLTEAGLNPNEIDALFVTHLHSDHVVGIPDLWLTGWFLGRDKPLRVWGPPGTQTMTQHIVQAFSFDVQIREAPPESLPPKGAEIDAQEIKQGKVYDEGSVQVSAFVVDHGPVKPAFGFRVDYLGHSVVISGDTKFSQNLIDFAKGADCLIHVAWRVGSKNSTPSSLRTIASAEDAAHVFTVVQPKLGVIYHYKDEEGLAEAVRAEYKGSFVVAKDLMSIVIGRTTTWQDRPRSRSGQ
jgi:ribonuclease Z